MKLLRRFLLSVVAFATGAQVGVLCYLLDYSLTWSIIDGFLGGVIAAGLVQPGVSTSRVLRATAGGIVSNDVNTFLGKDE